VSPRRRGAVPASATDPASCALASDAVAADDLAAANRLASAHEVAPGLLENVYVLGALCSLAGLALAASYSVWGAVWWPGCPLRELTGIPCPTCYGTRAMLAVVAGEWGRALRLNPLVGTAGIAMVASVPAAAAAVLGGWPRPRISPRLARLLARIGGALVVANWLYLLFFD